MAAGTSLGRPRLRRADVEIHGNSYPTSREVVRLLEFLPHFEGNGYQGKSPGRLNSS
jgi:hypothetical protein